MMKIIEDFINKTGIKIEYDPEEPGAIDSLENPIAADAAITGYNTETRTAKLWLRDPENVFPYVLKHELGHVEFQDGGMELHLSKTLGTGYFNITVADLMRELHLEANMVSSGIYTDDEIKERRGILISNWKSIPLNKGTSVEDLHPVFWTNMLCDCAIMFATGEIKKVRRTWERKGLHKIARMVNRISNIVDEYRDDMVGKSLEEFSRTGEYNLMLTSLETTVLNGIGKKAIVMIDDLESYPTVPFSGKTLNKVMIPDQLKDESIILIKKKDKKRPIFKWQDNRHTAQDSIVKSHLSRGGGYAIYCGGDLIVIDADTEMLQSAVEAGLPETFAVKTGGGGHHFYFRSDFGKKVVLYENDEDGDELGHLGEIQGGGAAYVVGPGSPHASGNNYAVSKDLPITYVDKDKIEEWIKANNFTTKKKKEKKVKLLPKSTGNASYLNDIQVTDFLMPDKATRAHDGYQGEHPVHGSKGGMNLHVNTRDNVWYCHRCLPAGELILTADGLRPIEEIATGDDVISSAGGIQKVTNTFKNEFEGDLYTINSATIPVKMTRGHPVLVAECKPCYKEYESYKACKPNCPRRIKTPHQHCGFDNSRGTHDEKTGQFTSTKVNEGDYQPKLKWVNVEDLNPEYHFLVIPKELPTTITKIDDFDLNPDFGNIMGTYLADGHIFKRPSKRDKNKFFYYTQFTLGSHKHDYINKLCDTISRNFERDARPFDRGTRQVITWTYSEAGQLFANELGRGAENKRLGRLLFTPEDTLNSMISTYIEGDGHVPKKYPNTTVVGSASKQLAAEVQIGLLRLGQFSRYYKYDQGEYFPKHLIQYVTGDKRKYHWTDDDNCYIPIKEVKHEHFNGSVYNLETEDHTYLTPFVVHNCNTGGGPIEAFAVSEGIIDCSDAGADCLTKEQFKDILERLRERGYNIPEQKHPTQRPDFTVDDRVKVKKMPDVLPDFDVITIVKPPRVGSNGGTHYAIMQLIKAGGGNYITHRHQGVEHALDIFARLNKTNESAVVWLEGKFRKGMCATGLHNCDECPYKPDETKEDHIGFFETELIAEALLDMGKPITKQMVSKIRHRDLKKISKNISVDRLCPYYILKAAEKKAKYCFTVINFMDSITPRDLLVLDEPQTVHYFYPQSVELLEITHTGSDWHVHSSLNDYMKELSKIEYKIHDKIDDKKRKSREDKLILEIINDIEKLNEILELSDANRLVSKEKEDNFLTNIINEIVDKLRGDSAVLDKLANYAKPGDNDPTCLFEAMIYPYEHPVFVSSDNNMRKTMYLIADASKPCLRLDNLLASKKIVLIGGIESEYFAKQLHDIYGKTYTTFEITDFPYKNNYVVIPVNASVEEGNPKVKQRKKEKRKHEEWEKKRQRRRNLMRVVKGLRKENIPALVWTGSKRKQFSIWDTQFNNGAYMLREEGVHDIKRQIYSGQTLIGYANSRIARAVDTPFIDVTALYDTSFISPYWAAIAKDDKRSKKEREFAEYMQNGIVMEESTNMALRITPTPGNDELQVKVVLCPSDELWKLKWIDDRIINGSSKNGNLSVEYMTRLVKEVVRRRVFYKEDGGKGQFDSKIRDWVIEETDAEEVSDIAVVGQLKLRGNSIWEQHVSNGSLLTAPSDILSDNNSNLSVPLFEIMRDNIVHALEDSGSRMSQGRLIRKVTETSIVRKEGKIRDVLTELIKAGIIKREKVNNKWMYRLKNPSTC